MDDRITMDPTAVWVTLVALLRQLHEAPENQEARAEATDCLVSLARWIGRGGFPPDRDRLIQGD